MPTVMNQIRGMNFYWTNKFSGRGAVVGVGADSTPLPSLTILVKIKKYSKIEFIAKGRNTP